MPGDDAIKDLAGKAAKEGKELAKDAAAVGRLIGSAGTDISSWWRLIKRWVFRIIKVCIALALIFVQMLAANSTAAAECGGGINDPASGPAYATTAAGGGEDMNLVQLAYDAVKKRYGNNPDGNRVLLATFETALTESGFRNLNHGDADSLGIFQQQASWGSAAQRTNPTYATTQFLNTLEKYRKQHPDFPAHKLAQATQRSACDGSGMPSFCGGVYGGNYLKSEARAKKLIEKVGGNFPDTGTKGTMNVDPNSTSVVPASTNTCDAGFGSGTTVKIGQKGVHVKSVTMSKGKKVTNDFVIDIPVGQRGKAIASGMTQLGVDYVFGGNKWAATPGGKGELDCSSFTQGALKRGANIQVPRTAAAQYAAAKKHGTLSDPSKLKPGDLIFWSEDDASGIYHVAMYLGMGTMNGGKSTPLIMAAPHPGDFVKIAPFYRKGNMYWADPGYTDDATATA